MKLGHISLLALGLAGLNPLVTAAPTELPVEHFFRKPEFAQLSLSPNGKYLAALAPVKGRLNLHIVDLTTRGITRLTSLPDDIQGYTWKTDDRLLFTCDLDGNESLGLYAIDRDGKNFRVLAAPAKAQIQSGGFAIRQTLLLDLLLDAPDEILVLSNERNELFFDVYRMDVHAGRKKRIETNPGKVQGWITDWNGVVRIAVETDKLKDRILYRPDEKSPWETIADFEFGNEAWSPLIFDFDNRTLYIASNEGRDKAAIYTYDVVTRTRGDRIFAHDNVDADAVMPDIRKKKIVGVGCYTEKPVEHWLDAEEAEIQAMVDAALPETENEVFRPRANADVALILSYSDREPGSYYLLDVKKREMSQLLRTREWIDPAIMAEMKPVTFKARDGLLMHGYLTLPPGSDGHNLPFIVNPHGGPQARDVWGFNPEVQFLANRGFAVMQVNFRGSTGYGLSFQKAGWRQWGREMQDDVTDAVKWAIEQGIADPKRVGIYGGSYGGYAAMAGLTFTPELYQFGMNVVGVTDLELLLSSLPRLWELSRSQFEKMIGSRETDLEELRAWSPIHHVDKIQAPLFMAYGEQDPRVVLKHATTLERELKRHSKKYELLVFHDEGHGFLKEENRLKYYSAMDAFLRPFR